MTPEQEMRLEELRRRASWDVKDLIAMVDELRAELAAQDCPYSGGPKPDTSRVGYLLAIIAELRAELETKTRECNEQNRLAIENRTTALMAQSERDSFRAQLEEARETNKRLNRRLQDYEAAIAEKPEAAGPGRRTLGRALANVAAASAMDERDKLRAENQRLRAALGAAAEALQHAEWAESGNAFHEDLKFSRAVAMKQIAEALSPAGGDK